MELNLFLDTHPNDLKSIEQFNKLTQERTVLAKQFQELYGPRKILAVLIPSIRLNGPRVLGLGRFNNDGMARGAAFSPYACDPHEEEKREQGGGRAHVGI